MKLSASHWGAYSAAFSGDDLIDFKPFFKDHAPFNKLKEVAKRARDPRRIKEPLVRKSVLEHGFLNAPKNLRGKEELIPISWDLASKLAANELKRVYKEHGPSAIYGGSYGWSCVGALNNPPMLLARMLNILGGFTGREQTYSTHAISIITPYISGLNEATARPTNWSNIIKHSSLVVMFSVDLLTTNEIAWNVPLHKAFSYIKQLRKANITTININPLCTKTAKYLGSKQHFIYPGTDTALILALCYALIELDLINHKFISTYTHGFSEFKQHLLKNNYSPSNMAQITGINKDAIYELARTMAKNRTMIIAGWGMQRAKFGEQPHRALICLAALLGQIGLDGGGYGFNYHYSDSGAYRLAAGILPTISPVVSGYERINEIIPVSRLVDALNNPNKPYFYKGEQRKFPKISCIYWAGGNPLHHHPGRSEQLKALMKADSFIVQDCFFTASAQHADLILPATCEQERYDLARSECSEFIFYMQPLLPAYEQARDDYEIFSSIIAHFGEQALSAFRQNRSQLEWLEYFYNHSSAPNLPNFEDFKHAGYVQIKQIDDGFIKHKDFIEHKCKLNTKSGKFELASSVLEGLNIDGIGKCASFNEPKFNENYPFRLISPHPSNRLHSQLYDGQIEPIYMNMQDTKELGFKEGDMLKLISANGYAVGKLKPSDDVMRGVICLHQGAWYSEENSSDANQLTSNEPSSELACGNQASACVKVQKLKDN